MQKGTILPVILILVLLATLGIGVYFLQTSRTSTTGEASSAFQKPASKPSPSPQSKKIAIESISLYFDLPPGFKLVSETEEEYFKRANGNIRKNFNYYIQYNPAGFKESFYIVPDGETNLDNSVLSAVIYENLDNLDPSQFYEDYWYYPFVWGDFTSRSKDIAPTNPEIIGGKTGGSGVVTYREGKPKFIYLPLPDKHLMMQIQLPTEDNALGELVLRSFVFN